MSKQKVEIMDGPFGTALVEDTEGVLYREIKTVRVKNGMLTEYITRREYRGDGDYNDTQVTRPLIQVGE
ncbi:hypothetical protein PQZ46_00285 [bacterium]|nr:hypothetical protein [bacterium]